MNIEYQIFVIIVLYINQVFHLILHKSLSYQWHHPEVTILEGVFARGDRRVGKTILYAYLHGCLFDAWTDYFSFERWEEAFSATGVDMDFYTIRERSLDEILPRVNFFRRPAVANLDQLVMIASGVVTADDCYNVVRLGADGTGATSGILNAPSPAVRVQEMAEAIVRAYKEREGK